ncbi:polyketide synthase dehydratase domain-containing protein, partial [Streptomyces spiramenti]
GVEHKPAKLPLISTLTGEPESVFGSEYWVRQVRESVRFADAVAAAQVQGVTRFLEIGPDTTLTALAAGSVEGTVVATSHREHDETTALMAAMAALHVDGWSPDWTQLLAQYRPAYIDLPTYPFQRQRYWLHSGVATPEGTGGHPLIASATRVADTGDLLFTSKLSTATHPWLADHAVGGAVIVPGTALVELLIPAGDEAGLGRIDELTLEAPLVLPERMPVELQLAVRAPGGDALDGKRQFTMHSRPDGSGPEAPWTRHATGVLATAGAEEPFELTQWPPKGAEPVQLDGFYDRLADDGLAYGPMFRGLRSAWTLADEAYAEVALPDQALDEAGAYGLHPALFDAALHAIGVSGAASGEPVLPFAWTGVELHAAGASSVRVRVAPAGNGAVSLRIADSDGKPVATVEALHVRPASGLNASAAPASGITDAMFTVGWETTELTQADQAQPELFRVLRAGGEAVGRAPADVRGEVSRVLGVVQSWLAEGAADARLVVLTRGAVALPGEDV